MESITKNVSENGIIVEDIQDSLFNFAPAKKGPRNYDSEDNKDDHKPKPWENYDSDDDEEQEDGESDDDSSDGFEDEGAY